MDIKNIIVKMIFGSHLYGTATEYSDRDYKGVYIPSKEQIFLGKIPKAKTFKTKVGYDSKNVPGDMDFEIYSLQYFIQLACSGQTVALDMLHAPDEMVLDRASTWDEIVGNREKFYTKNLQAFIGYARRQAAKYGIKGSRLCAVKKVINLLTRHSGFDRLTSLWDELPIDEHLYMVEANPDGIRQYQVCGKVFQERSKVECVLVVLNTFFNEYGNRTKKAAENKGIDWKAMSHALRAAYEVRQILTEKTITFPLEQADFLRRVKQGKCDYLTVVAPALENLMDEVEALSLKSDLPDKVDRKYWDSFIIQTLEKSIRRNPFLRDYRVWSKFHCINQH